LLPFLTTEGSRVLEKKVNETQVSKTVFSHLKTDHAAISLELVDDSNVIKGPGLWKMNCLLLYGEDYITCNDITEKIPIFG